MACKTTQSIFECILLCFNNYGYCGLTLEIACNSGLEDVKLVTSTIQFNTPITE